LAAEAALAEVTAAIRRLRKEADDARSELSTVEQSLSAFTLEESLLAERTSSLAGQRQSLTATLAARRTRLDET